MLKKLGKKLQKPSNHLQMTFKWLQNGYPGGGGGGEGEGGFSEEQSNRIGNLSYH